MLANGYHGEGKHRRTPTAVTIKDDIWLINVLSNGVARPKAFFNKITERLNHHEIAVDLISSSNKSISLAICTSISEKEKESLNQAVAELKEIGKVIVTKQMSIVSVVGHRMRNMVGVAGKYHTQCIQY